jgi:argininosuccinate lyase
MKKSKALWGGRFSTEASSSMQAFSQSVSFDRRLYAHDIAGSVAHARMLRRIGLLTPRELREIVRGLTEISKEIAAGKFRWLTEREDVHMNIESALTARTAAGAKLHTGRSRNDQVALDMRLWLRDQIQVDSAAIVALQEALAVLAEREISVVIPGYTHLQRAQPVLLAHHLLAYVEMLDRDYDRLVDCALRANVMPLGSGAIAGSTLRLDRAFVARQLGFARLSQNSMDAVSDRDFIVEYCAAAALTAVHLSRLAEDLILWSSAEFGFIRIGDAYTTGSSLMPQKKNPDAAELTRGKSARVIGNLVSMLTLLKGLPMTYNRDLQEDKERLFDTADTIQSCLKIMTEMLGSITVQVRACRAAASDPLLLATDLADWLVKKGMPFREAHHAVGEAVAQAERTGMAITDLPVKELRKISPLLNAKAMQVFSVERALHARDLEGAPNPTRVRGQLERWEKVLRKRKRKHRSI